MNAPDRLKSLACAAAVLALAACTNPAGTQSANTSANGHAANLPAAKPVGPSVSCIPLASARESRVRDDWTIDFKAGGKRWYRTVLPYRCNGLGFERAFSYATSISQLCSADIITVFQQSGGGSGPRNSCGLGQFQLVELEK
jgi:hypothetical protein